MLSYYNIDTQNIVHLVYECFNHLNFNFIMYVFNGLS